MTRRFGNDNKMGHGYVQLVSQESFNDGRCGDVICSPVLTTCELFQGEKASCTLSKEYPKLISVYTNDHKINNGGPGNCPFPVENEYDWETKTELPIEIDLTYRLEDLPDGVLETILGFTQTLPDRAAIAGTCKKFYEFSFRPHVLKLVSLKSVEQDDGLVQKDSTVTLLVERLLTLAQAGNAEALLYLARIAIYVENDMMVGASLLMKAAREGNYHAMHELAIVLEGSNLTGEEMQQQFFQDAVEGSCQARLESFMKSEESGDLTMQIFECMAEMRSVVSLNILSHNVYKSKRRCYNPFCFRTAPKFNKPFTAEWEQLRTKVLECGNKLSQAESSAFSTGAPCCLVCAGCNHRRYCSTACSQLGWYDHKDECPGRRRRRHR